MYGLPVVRLFQVRVARAWRAMRAEREVVVALFMDIEFVSIQEAEPPDAFAVAST